MDWPSLRPIKSTRIYEEIVRQVKAMITEGSLKFGTASQITQKRIRRGTFGSVKELIAAINEYFREYNQVSENFGLTRGAGRGSVQSTMTGETSWMLLGLILVLPGLPGASAG